MLTLLAEMNMMRPVIVAWAKHYVAAIADGVMSNHSGRHGDLATGP